MNSQRGVTIVELLVVVLIIAVLSILAFSATQSSRLATQNSTCVSRLRQVGIALFAYAADHRQTIPSAWNDGANGQPLRAWATRLVYENYISSPDAFYCPSFFPRNDAEADRKVSVYNATGPHVYGMRKWVEPGTGWLTSELEAGKRLLSAIEDPADFFIVADSVWPSHRSQGYAISPGLSEHAVHLRHSGMANALFADGHVEAKQGSYFEKLNQADRQRIYTGNQDRKIYTTEATKF